MPVLKKHVVKIVIDCPFRQTRASLPGNENTIRSLRYKKCRQSPTLNEFTKAGLEMPCVLEDGFTLPIKGNNQFTLASLVVTLKEDKKLRLYANF